MTQRPNLNVKGGLGLRLTIVENVLLMQPVNREKCAPGLREEGSGHIELYALSAQ